MKKQLIECVPNFSEGRDLSIIKQITDVIESVPGVKLLDVDPGKATNRTVVTFVGEPAPVVEAAFLAIKKAAELIDMRTHKGEHPRMGATDVCPLVPVSNISMEETAQFARQLAERVGRELPIPIYCYENAATRPERRNLASVRAGEYEGLPDKLSRPEWKPDFGPAQFNAKAGATAIGARDFLVAYNINLNTTSERRANSIAFDVREKGRVKRIGDPINGEVVLDEKGEPVREPGALKAVKAIGWFIEEYGIAQISMNLTNISVTPLHVAFEACCQSAESRGMRVTGSELVGLVPLKVLLDAGKFFLQKQRRSAGVSEEEVIKIAVRSLGLDELAPFDPKKKVIEYLLADSDVARLVSMDLRSFSNETASESVAPGGGSISAYVGALGVSLATMVANLSSHKRQWDDRWEEFSGWAEKGQQLKDDLLRLVDEDTNAFNGILEAFRLPKSSDEEKAARKEAIQQATKFAIEVPFRVMRISYDAFELIQSMVEKGNPNSITDAGVGALCARAAIHGAFMNVKINLKGFKDAAFAESILSQANEIVARADEWELRIRQYIHQEIEK
ncbi:MAG: glutamate formimidoyltransferase [Saprospirales bacterium]|nr:glutamate formimidoyltransferase [Saprospirales bacterium]MBK8493127.1 glutamate formimidoyltransferase [Saprospirales bacterium]